MNTLDGNLNAAGGRWGVVVSRWNSFITERLLEGAVDAVVRHGGDADAITVARVPGSFELPLAVQRMARSGEYDAIIALGCVIRGATPHFDYVAAEVSKGVAAASMDTGVPVGFGVLTTDTIEQAVERAGTKAGNKGWEAATAAMEMVDLFRSMGE
ncbi:MAG: 6,7-dimethyl-8-ribityllumazine synthase [Myxococcota bacterium]